MLGVLDKSSKAALDHGRIHHRRIATFPWIRNLIGFYDAGELVGFDSFANVKRVLDTFVARPAVVKGLAIPARG